MLAFFKVELLDTFIVAINFTTKDLGHALRLHGGEVGFGILGIEEGKVMVHLGVGALAGLDLLDGVHEAIGKI